MEEDLFDDTNISLTVGWFTTQFPVCLTLEKDNNIAEVIKSIKEQLRGIPNKGIGYGLLRYLHHDVSVREQLSLENNNEISFNYLGQFVNVHENSSLISIADQPSGFSVSDANHRTHIIGLNAFISNGELMISWSYSGNLHKKETIENLGNIYIIELQQIVEHCLQPESKGYTPSDFPFTNINQDELDDVLTSNIGNDLTSNEGILL